MNKNKLNIIVAIFISPFFIIIGCKSNPTTTLPEDDHQVLEPSCYDSLSVEEIKESIIGEWEWHHSIIMQRHLHPPENLITPATAGYTMQRRFDSNNMVRYFKNNQLTETHSYKITKFKVLPSDKCPRTNIKISNASLQLLFFPDTMMIGDGERDGIDDYFIRNE